MKKNIGLIIILIILTLGLGGFIFYDKVIDGNSDFKSNEVYENDNLNTKDNNTDLLLEMQEADDNSINQSDIKGYWIQVERNLSGDVTDLTNNKNSYLEITDNRLFFYSYFWDTETYGVSDKYYKLETDKIYYDYYELKGSDWKENIDEAFGGIFNVSINNGRLILTEYNNDKNKDDGYEINTYEKIEAKDWPIEE